MTTHFSVMFNFLKGFAPDLKKMRKSKRGADHLNTGFCKSRRASKNGSLVSGWVLGDYGQGVQSGPIDRLVSHLSNFVASITLYNGDTILFSCSGIAVEHQGGCHLTRFLTSAKLVSTLNGTNKDDEDLKIEVRCQGNEVYMGLVAEFDLDRNFAVVNVHADRDALVGYIQHPSQIPRGGEKLVAIGRSISGDIIAKEVKLDGDSRVSDKHLECEISEALEGGPLVSVDGVVGMNHLLTTRVVLFLPIFKHYWKKTGLARSKTSQVYRFGARALGYKSNSHPEVPRGFLYQEQLDLFYMGYPKIRSSMLARMVLVNTFEETFGDEYGKGVWKFFSKRASCSLNRNVVALASFNAETRFFACTGFFIEWKGSTKILTSASLVRKSGDEGEIVKNLRIEVLLNSQYREGTLEDYSLHYNIALVSVKDYRALRPSNTLLDSDMDFEVAAIGRCFESGALMATSGEVVFWTGAALDCIFLSNSTCKITKAGIGGPLVSLDGDVIGMNFYDKRIGTPFMCLEEIYDVLASLGTQSKPGKMVGDNETKLNRWPVPMPRWCNRDDADEDKPGDDVFDPKSGRYGYHKGKKFFLF